jgi:hypothetical protein
MGPGRVDVPAAGRQATGDQHQYGRPERRRLVDGALVLLQPAVLLEEAAPAQRGDRQPGVADQGGRLGHPVLLGLLTPQPDPGHAGVQAAGHQVGQRPTLGGGLVQGEAFHG